MKCPHEDCGYEWMPRVEKPKRCPKCQRWLAYVFTDSMVMVMKEKTPRYEMRFVPYDAQGRMKTGAPQPGVKGCPDDGDIALLPLENRWEEWWELVDEESVPKKELAKDQTDRDEFMVKARAAEAERAKRLQPVGVPIQGSVRRG